jgi:hypothetical protein
MFLADRIAALCSRSPSVAKFLRENLDSVSIWENTFPELCVRYYSRPGQLC